MKHLSAVNAAVRGRTVPAAHRPLLELARVLARQMDAAGAEPSARLASTYLSTVRSLSRAIGVPTSGPIRSNIPVGKKLPTLREAHADARKGES